MKKHLSFIIVFFVGLLSVSAQSVDFNLSFTPALDKAAAKVYVAPQSIVGANSTRTMRAGEAGYSGVVPASDSGFYVIVVVADNTQKLLPVYIGDKTEASLNVQVSARFLELNDTPDNKALSVITTKFADYERRMWVEGGLSTDVQKNIISSFLTTTDSILAQGGLTSAVEEYIKVCAYTRAFSLYNSIPRAQNIAPESVGFDVYDVLPVAQSVLDCESTSMFAAASEIIIPAGFGVGMSLLEKIDTLFAVYKTPSLRTNIANNLLGKFVNSYNYAEGLEAGLAQVNMAIEQYGASAEWATEFMKRQSAIVGADFPADVVLVDSLGNVVDFSSFKGKYVYIDMWASWCGPCCREVPYLQELEAGLQNDDVVFVSISIDSDVDAWKNKMVELGMHGNQLHDRDGVLGNALNVRGIPFFLIYDKDGKLYKYGALRPSSGSELKTLLEGLH